MPHYCPLLSIPLKIDIKKPLTHTKISGHNLCPYYTIQTNDSTISAYCRATSFLSYIRTGKYDSDFFENPAPLVSHHYGNLSLT